MAWSIFTQGGGKGAAVTWAQDFLQALGVPTSSQNVQFVYDWEVSEGGGGKYNPLNQGPVPGHPELTTTGQQYGGGAADFASWQAGITGAVDYVNMSAYAGIKSALQKSDYSGAKAALIASPWAASHYGGGSSFSSETPPGASALASGGGSVSGGQQASTTGINLNPLGGLSVSGVVQDIISTVLGALGIKQGLKDAFERFGLIILGFALVILGIKMLSEGGGSSSSGPVNRSAGSEETSEEAPEETSEEESKSSVKSASPDEVKTSTKGVVKKTGAEEAVEAAAAA